MCDLNAAPSIFDCPHLNCPRRFETQDELNGHLATCEYGTQELYNDGEETVIKELVDVRGGGEANGETTENKKTKQKNRKNKDKKKIEEERRCIE